MLMGVRAVKRAAPRKYETLALDKLKPGQSISITSAPRRSDGKRA